LRQLVDERLLAFADLILVLASGAVWMLKPEWGFWFLPVALLPAMLRLLGGKFPFQKTQLDGLVVVFLITALAGYWASYDHEVAGSKFWFIVTAVLLYYALSAQPKENLVWVSIVFFLIGVGISIHFVMTYDFIGAPRKLQIANMIGRWIMEVRPQIEWNSIHPNYVAGIAAITTPFSLYPLVELRIRQKNSVVAFILISIGVAISLFAIFMATSRGIWMAIISAVGVWLLWRFLNLSRINLQIRNKALFPVLVLACLCLIIAVLYIGPANQGGAVSSEYFYGTGSRTELFERSIYLFRDFAVTGGGLGAFPGLYSQYMLGIPYFNVPNSHNMFLDVAIEQGLLGGLSFLVIFLASIWFVSHALISSVSGEIKLFSWLVLFALVIAVIHGMVDDYLYNGAGAMLSLFLAGLSGIVWRASPVATRSLKTWDNPTAVLTTLIGVALIALLYLDKISSVWYANLGAVQLARVELANFPESGWPGIGIIPKLHDAETSLQTSLRLDPGNLTANHRLGVIYMLYRDFESASRYLETAYLEAPNHRGLRKSLGYSYLWMGDEDRARLILAEIPELDTELDAYYWWWSDQDRVDLSNKAYLLMSSLHATQGQP
jgi:O-antigen ligase